MPEQYYRHKAGFDLFRIPDERPYKTTSRSKEFLLSFLFSQLERNAESRAVFALQVGANDGKIADPLFPQFAKYGWHGLLIEPMPTYFTRVNDLHSSRPHVEVLNIGCSSQHSQMTLYHLRPEHEQIYPKYARGCASLDRERMIQTLAKCTSQVDALQHIGEAQINLVPLSEIVAQRVNSKVDLLVVDVEGHEPEVLSGAKLDEMMPSIAIVELNSPSVRNDTIKFFRDLDYTLFSQREDMIALSPELKNVQALADLCAFMGAKPV